MTHVFRALWPVTQLMSLDALVSEATTDLPRVTAQARARLVGRPHWSVRQGQDVPGSGGARWVLVCEAAAVRADRRQDCLTGEIDRPLREAS